MEKPCEKCHIAHKCGIGWADTPDMCADYGLWIATQEGYAAGREELAREIVERLRMDGEPVELSPDRGSMSVVVGAVYARRIEDWLKEKGVM